MKTMASDYMLTSNCKPKTNSQGKNQAATEGKAVAAGKIAAERLEIECAFKRYILSIHLNTLESDLPIEDDCLLEKT